ncbi:LLM class flavin-dependent oxidoreductase [Hyphomicrobium sp. D-2]|uniref:LLM class flavin-dependent oxidoreductase n=1 Tax=Hyphomicrobium sp. D-2 TaxID=3041621 RepID=UPI0024539270|nr:LLM class flavin-dependent oxidoreductase [Hyphomicrobium sp. D-2]MDH4982131.1 LLM class flavin-dependent oxidoreductase [Hyphomicrobium sp. D-2]
MRIDVAGIGREQDRISHADFLALMREIDQLGFDGIWFNEFHFQTPPQPYPSPLLLAASIFTCTQRLRVGTSVLVLPLHDPLLLAEQIEQLQWHSGGRFDAGFGRGTDPATFAKLNIDAASTRERFESALVTLKASLAPTASDSRQPIYLAGYTPETLGFAAMHGFPLLLSLEPPEGRQIELYNAAVAAGQFRSRLPESSLTRYVVIGHTEPRRKIICRHYCRCCKSGAFSMPSVEASREPTSCQSTATNCCAIN